MSYERKDQRERGTERDRKYDEQTSTITVDDQRVVSRDLTIASGKWCLSGDMKLSMFFLLARDG